ncbi:hypothetical protein IE81DRAFT_254787 [Ceraceosorus guamensis]|uniref:Uncharacterized protein n=1 Tax=Ceraceosorus guamensis TaxID=1522189 RepID=A0A316W7T9_9BASI|nr:hypothetical protein IE81DRAFT_254787 [Ceraceosorus guamensis]PWN44791.1 hypothetical protein IE81DRAFT_254787 [Ceraceosorus guamensis]
MPLSPVSPPRYHDRKPGRCPTVAHPRGLLRRCASLSRQRLSDSASCFRPPARTSLRPLSAVPLSFSLLSHLQRLLRSAAGSCVLTDVFPLPLPLSLRRLSDNASGARPPARASSRTSSVVGPPSLALCRRVYSISASCARPPRRLAGDLPFQIDLDGSFPCILLSSQRLTIRDFRPKPPSRNHRLYRPRQARPLCIINLASLFRA